MRGRLAGAIVAGLLVAGACGAGDDDTAATDATTSTAAADGEAPGATGTGPSGPPAGSEGTAPGPEPTTAGTADPAPGAGPPTTTSTAPVPAPGGVGAYAPVFLRAEESERLVLEVRSQPGAEPREATVARVRDVLAATSGKEVVLSGGTVAGGARSWSAADIRAVADTSGLATSRDAAVLRLLFLRGGLAESDTALGVAVRADTAAVFADRVDEAAGLLGNGARIELAVTVHEVGHLLGLVDLHLSTGRQDPEHPGHSPNPDSVMYYAVESTLVSTILGGGPPTDFDEADRADLAAIRSG